MNIFFPLPSVYKVIIRLKNKKNCNGVWWGVGGLMGPLSTRGLLKWVSFPREHRQRVEGSPVPWGGTQQRPLVPTPRPSCQLRQVAPAGSLKSLELVLTGQSSFLRAGRRGPQTAIVTPHLSSVGCTVRKQNPLLKALILTHHGLDRENRTPFGKGRTDWCTLATIGRNISFSFIPRLFCRFEPYPGNRCSHLIELSE